MRAGEFKDKKVLVMGLGVLGGGVATTKWFVKHGAKVTVTDLRTRRELAVSIRALGTSAKKVKFVLGHHRPGDFKTHDLIVVNPAVPRESKFLKIARRAGNDITNDAKIFLDLVRNPVVAVTGTRGKTTTTNWIAHFMKGRHLSAVAAGNTPEMPLLSVIDRLVSTKIPAVVELSSWQLEQVDRARRGPDIAIITNLYPDHLNRYRGMNDYARAKANIFARQKKTQSLILNAEDEWTPFFLKRKLKSATYFFSLKPLPGNRDGIYLSHNRVLSNFRKSDFRKLKTEVLNARAVRAFAPQGTHNLRNLLAAMLAAHLLGIPWPEIRRRIPTLPQIPFRQEFIVTRKHLTVVNDTAATSPDGTIAALARFKNKNLILIAGGTDKKLEFNGWARAVKRRVKPERLFLLGGSATKKMVRALRRVGYFGKSYPQLFEELPSLIRAVKEKVRQDTSSFVLFSPGAASFEKFRNEFDRGRKFNLYWR
ncbi:MAG: UDP-N-acetylmuramoyl-L-alanine--D-glutamate ligase [Candidatus Jorgensenbacteria bacterium]